MLPCYGDFEAHSGAERKRKDYCYLDEYSDESEEEIPTPKKQQRKRASGGTTTKRQKKRKLVVFHRALTEAEKIDPIHLYTPFRIYANSYLPNWGLEEAFRELLTNTIDQARSVAAKFALPGELEMTDVPNGLKFHVGDDLLAEVKWRRGVHRHESEIVDAGIKKSKLEAEETVHAETVVIDLLSYSSYLPWESFFPGVSTKRDNAVMIGKHGEGLSAACNVLCREGCNVNVTCKSYSAKVMDYCDASRVQLYDRKAKDDTVCFEIVFPPPSTWVDVLELVNAVRLPPAATRLVAARGELLTDFGCRGKQYNRGIFVSECEKGQCLFGYNYFDPEKTLLQSRDRNSHNVDACLKECGSILSEAILVDPAVRTLVLREGLIHHGPITAAGVADLPVFDDLKTGRYITEEARQVLRAAHCARLPGSPATAIFCGNATEQVRRIAEAEQLAVVHSHLALHNHESIEANFFARLAHDAVDLPVDSVFVTKADQMLHLLAAKELRQSQLLSDQPLGFWRVEDTVYITGLASLGVPDAAGAAFSEDQEASVHHSLGACDVDLRRIISLVRLLKEAYGTGGLHPDAVREMQRKYRAEFEAALRDQWEQERAAEAAAAADAAAAKREAEVAAAAKRDAEVGTDMMATSAGAGSPVAAVEPGRVQVKSEQGSPATEADSQSESGTWCDSYACDHSGAETAHSDAEESVLADVNNGADGTSGWDYSDDAGGWGGDEGEDDLRSSDAEDSVDSPLRVVHASALWTEGSPPAELEVTVPPARNVQPPLVTCLKYRGTAAILQLYTCGGTPGKESQLKRRVREFLDFPDIRRVLKCLRSAFTVVAFAAHGADGSCGRMKTVFRQGRVHLLLNFSGRNWTPEDMHFAFRAELKKISVADVVMDE